MPSVFTLEDLGKAVSVLGAWVYHAANPGESIQFLKIKEVTITHSITVSHELFIYMDTMIDLRDFHRTHLSPSLDSNGLWEDTMTTPPCKHFAQILCLSECRALQH